MTNQHPITPPPELVQQWLGTYFGTTVTGEVSGVELALATQAARWGADQELEACCSEVQWLESTSTAIKIRDRRRPKLPSLKEQALAALEDDDIDVYLIRRALEALPND